MLSHPAFEPPERTRFRDGRRRGLVAVPSSAVELVLAGEIDVASCTNIPADVERLCWQGHGLVRIDLGSVTYIDAATVRAFLEARERARALGSDVMLRAVHGLPLRVLRICELDTVLVEGNLDGE